MTSITTVDGLVSGLQTSSIISQLMQLEARPQTNMKDQVAKEGGVVTAYQSVNTKMAALKTAAEALTSASAWQSAKVSSSSTGITATATAGAIAGTSTFDVKRLAATHVMTALVPPTGVTAGHGLDLTVGGELPVHVDVDDDTPQGVADAINAAGLGVRASVVQTDQGTVLQMTAAKSGTAAAFNVTGLTVGASIVTQGVDAQIAVGDPAAGGYTVASATNTFTGVIPNVTFTASAKQDGVSLTVVSDSGSIADKMQTMIDAANGALSQISTLTAYAAGGKASALSGDYAVRQLQSHLLSGISSGQADYGSFKQVGIQLDSSGKIKFDRAAFLAAYDANPTAVQGAVSDGLATTLQAVATKATDFTTGSLTTAIQSHNDRVSALNHKITDWDTRLADKQASLQRQYSNLESALGKMKNQSSWLSGQIAGLQNNSNG
jgi:flagellar hook-associated protein 2